MTIDYCAGTGSFPFRRVPDADPGALVRLMDEEGIDKALVSAFECILYRNVQAGNELLLERLSGHEDRLVGAATANPRYHQAAEDARRCIREFSMRALRLIPGFHGYRLTEGRTTDFLEAVADLAVPISLVMRVEDERQRHWLVEPAAVAVENVARVVERFPGIHFVLERPSTTEVMHLLACGPQLTNWSFEMSGRFMAAKPITPNLGTLVDRLGATRILFGTDAPLQYPRSARLKLASVGLSEADDRAICGDNARRLLGLL